jgi:putative endonuclease
MAYVVYIVECADGTLYTGLTTNLERRIAEHNSSRLGARYTRSRRPVICIYAEVVGTRSIAAKREIAIKRLPRSKKLELAGNWVRDPACAGSTG